MLTSVARAPILLTLLAVMDLVAGSQLAAAQVAQTWVSGVGDDAKACSRTAPGKTFSGAIVKTTISGVISVLDPGDYGTVTVTKSITIDGTGSAADIVALGVTGVTIDAVGGVVILRHLHINGVEAGMVGIRILNAATVYVEDCTIAGFSEGILLYGGAQLIVRDSTVRDCGTGIDLAPGPFLVSLNNVHVEGGSAGVVAGNQVRLTGVGVTVTGCSDWAIALNPGGTATFTDSNFSNNGAGLRSSGSMWVGSSRITNNLGSGLMKDTFGFIRSLKENDVVANNPDGKFTASVPQK